MPDRGCAEERQRQDQEQDLPVVPAVASGGAIGFLSGLTGTGGGIFLSPLLVFTRWADMRESASLAAAFIMVNPVSGLLGNVSSVRDVP
ncbi:MAG: TSUP family transporter, partial [Thermomicrobiales bacterium]